MKSKAAFTKKDLVVVLGCAVFLLMNIGAIGTGGRRRAREAACLSNLFQWGACWSMYADDNDGSFIEGNPSGQDPGKSWIYLLQPYYRDGMLKLCPMATKPYAGNVTSPYTAYGPFWGSDPDDWGPRTDSGTPGGGCASAPWEVCFAPEKYGFSYTEDDRYVSYEANAWVRNDPRLQKRWDNAWRTPTVKGAGNIPMMVGGKQFYTAMPDNGDEIPAYEGEPAGVTGGWAMPMKTICINRHNYAINGVFVDFSARRIGLKGLWKLKWHRTYDINAGPTGDEWPEWMRDLKDY